MRSRRLAHNLIHRNCSEVGGGARPRLWIKCAADGRPRCSFFTHGKISLTNQWPACPPMSLLTILSTECVGKWRRARPAFYTGKCAKRVFLDAALFLRKILFPLIIKGFEMDQLPCSQSYPQKMCRTVLAERRATRYIAGFVSIRFHSTSGVPFARHSSSCRLAYLAIADCLHRRTGADY